LKAGVLLKVKKSHKKILQINPFGVYQRGNNQGNEIFALIIDAFYLSFIVCPPMFRASQTVALL
jgi:hypothetical protein